MKHVIFVVITVFIVSCGGTTSTTKNKNTLKGETARINNTQEVVIWNNISQKDILFHINKFKIDKINIIESLSNQYCENLNPNYIAEGTAKITYSINNLIACSNHDMKDTDYSGDKTYIITYGSLKTEVGMPSLFSNFNFMLGEGKPKKEKPRYVEKEYSMDSIIKDVAKYITTRITRNVSEQWFIDTINAKGEKSFPIYHIPLDVNISCEQFNFTKVRESEGYKTYRLLNTNKQCGDVTADPNSITYGSNTYILML